MTQSLEERLAPIIAKYEETHTHHYLRVSKFLDRIGQMDQRPKPGDRAPDFALPAHDGSVIKLSDLLRERPIVVVFIRGKWCPYCHEQVRALSDAAPEYEKSGIGVLAITPEIGGRAAELSAELALPFPVLSDLDSGVALSYGCLYPVPPEEREFLVSNGVDLKDLYGSGAWFMPVSSAFGVGSDGFVKSVFGDADPRVRPEPDAILSSMTSSGAKD